MLISFTGRHDDQCHNHGGKLVTLELFSSVPPASWWYLPGKLHGYDILESNRSFFTGLLGIRYRLFFCPKCMNKPEG